MKTLRNVQLLGEDGGEGHVDADHDDDGDRNAKVAEGSANLKNFSFLKKIKDLLEILLSFNLAMQLRNFP